MKKANNQFSMQLIPTNVAVSIQSRFSVNRTEETMSKIWNKTKSKIHDTSVHAYMMMMDSPPDFQG